MLPTHAALALSLGLLLSPASAQPLPDGRLEQHGRPKAVGSLTRSDSIDLLHTRIDLDLRNATNGIISAAATLTLTPKVDGITTLPLDLLVLAVDSVTMDGAGLAFTHPGEELRIALPGTFGPEDTLDLTVHYHGDPVTDPSGFGGFYTLSSYQYDLGVAFDAVPHSFGRSWFPCFDNFVERCTFEFLVRTNGGRSVFANGALVDVTDLGNGERLTHWRIAAPIPSYLASVAAADYAAARDTFPSTAGIDIPVALVAHPGDTTAMKASFLHLRNAFDTYERWFGPYRWERVGYVLTSAGAMEHPTNICYPDFVVDGTLTEERLMAHELSHHWFGDLITCRRAEEMYINEGFADYCSYLFLEDLYGEDAYLDIVRSVHHDMVVKAHLLDGGWFALADVPQAVTYGEHSYKKGADIVRTLRGYLGDDLFRTGFQRVLANDAYTDMSSMELRDSLAAATGVDLTDFFNDWILQPGWAAFEVDSFHVAPAGGQSSVQVFAQQKVRGPAALYHHVPVTVTCVAADGTVHRSLADLDDEFPVATVTCPFAPAAVRLNDDDRLALAVTTDVDTLTSTGATNLALSDLWLQTSALTGPVPLRVEEYWVAADEGTEEPFAFQVSPDRWWRVSGTFPAGTAISARITVDGRAGLNTATDVGLVQATGGVAFSEDSLVVLYRPDARMPWAVHPAVSASFLGSHSDGLARLTFQGLTNGDYTIGWRKSGTGVAESGLVAGTWRHFPDPADDVVLVEAPDGASTERTRLVVRDVQGRTLIDRPLTGPRTWTDVGGIASQTVMLSVERPGTAPVALGPLVIIR